jgi:hypothetical protein
MMAFARIAAISWAQLDANQSRRETLLKLAAREKVKQLTESVIFDIETQVNIRRPCSTATLPEPYTARRVRWSSWLTW